MLCQWAGLNSWSWIRDEMMNYFLYFVIRSLLLFPPPISPHPLYFIALDSGSDLKWIEFISDSSSVLKLESCERRPWIGVPLWQINKWTHERYQITDYRSLISPVATLVLFISVKYSLRTNWFGDTFYWKTHFKSVKNSWRLDLKINGQSNLILPGCK